MTPIIPIPERPIKRYKTVSAAFVEDFDNAVLEKLQEGYDFLDDLQVVSYQDGGVQYVRTMIKRSF